MLNGKEIHMKQKFHKFFWVWDYEKEIRWINDMAAKGFGLCHVGLCTYWFEDCAPGEFIYGLELAENSPESTAGREYLSFLSECGTDFVGNWMRWIYLRRKAADGPFNLHNDLDSKLAHIKRIFSLLLPVILLNAGSAALNITVGLSSHRYANVWVSSLNTAITILGTVALIRMGRQIRRMKKERQLHE